ncbi:hypothetical protein M885DRAFT_289853 [Pelagophyceae sp. CCMP2097]|nr:hypothetical protein M885DRAFT_289853 [Pelagophyceae sp. CCMP2097]
MARGHSALPLRRLASSCQGKRNVSNWSTCAMSRWTCRGVRHALSTRRASGAQFGASLGVLFNLDLTRSTDDVAVFEFKGHRLVRRHGGPRHLQAKLAAGPALQDGNRLSGDPVGHRQSGAPLGRLRLVERLREDLEQRGGCCLDPVSVGLLIVGCQNSARRQSSL